MSSEANGNGEMRVDPSRAKQLVANLREVVQRIDSVRAGRNVRLIAVSKLKPAADILALHQPPADADGAADAISHFGENYAQELTEKAALLPRSIRWHMIGGLQTNKCKPLAEQVANLYCVSSVDTAKKADALEKGRAALLASSSSSPSSSNNNTSSTSSDPLRILVQVNTSGEDSKSGVAPGAAAVDLCRHVREQCPHLRLAGLMTIGAIARSREAEAGKENEDFVTLRETRDRVAAALGVPPADLELSMGMSADFEAAIGMGSDEVRVGTTIFGQRPARKDATIV